MKLYIIRHGETSWNKEKKLQGRKDIMLDADGIRLAELTGEGMKNIDFDLVISSPLMRARQTAELVLAGREIPMITDKRIIIAGIKYIRSERINDSYKLSFAFTKISEKDRDCISQICILKQIETKRNNIV